MTGNKKKHLMKIRKDISRFILQSSFCMLVISCGCLQLSGKSFPLCMRQLHQSLRENHHLRHGGRMQYGLFLKGIGLSLEQALQFWRSEFIRGKVDADKVVLTT